jgi:Uma2 family endonuclease
MQRELKRIRGKPMSQQWQDTAPATASTTAPVAEPPLESGDRLTGAEFWQRYMAHPEIKQAELVAGVVYVASPVRFTQHGNPHANLVIWLGVYAAATPYVSVADNVTVKLEEDTTVQPDALLIIDPAHGGQATITDDDYLAGAPELIVEIAASSAAYDLHDKRAAYARSGVREYLVVQMYERRIDWFVLREGQYEPVQPDGHGILRGTVFPGLWLDTAAFWNGDIAAMLARAQKGLSTPDHAAFVARLQQS